MRLHVCVFISVTCTRVLAGAFYLSICLLELCACVSALLKSMCVCVCVCVYQKIHTRGPKQRMWHAQFHSVWAFYKCENGMVPCAHLSLMPSASSPYKSPCKSESSDYNAGHVLIQTSVTNGAMTSSRMASSHGLTCPVQWHDWVIQERNLYNITWFFATNGGWWLKTKLWNTQTRATA